LAKNKTNVKKAHQHENRPAHVQGDPKK